MDRADLLRFVRCIGKCSASDLDRFSRCVHIPFHVGSSGPGGPFYIRAVFIAFF